MHVGLHRPQSFRPPLSFLQHPGCRLYSVGCMVGSWSLSSPDLDKSARSYRAGCPLGAPGSEEAQEACWPLQASDAYTAHPAAGTAPGHT